MNMEDIYDWSEKIITLIEKLKKNHQELIAFLDEIPITIADDTDPHLSISILKEYHQKLLNLENLKKLKCLKTS